MKVLHICILDKFIPPFIHFIRNEFSIDDHYFYIQGDINKYPYVIDNNIFHHRNICCFFILLKKMIKADKIILHGLFDKKIILLLFLNPYFLKKCYWVIWGGDLYSYRHPKTKIKSKVFEYIRSVVIRKIGFLLTYMERDVDIARKIYGAKGQYLETLGYLSNVVDFKKTEVMSKLKKNTINILAGNSATETNEHFEIFQHLKKYKDENIKIYAPLSYGNFQYAQKVISKGQEIFGNKFVGITEFLEKDKYLEFLNSIDIAIFNHNRQQAMGNTIILLSMGKTIYLRPGTTQWHFFQQKNIKVFDVNHINLNTSVNLSENITIVTQYFSYDNYYHQWKRIFSQ